MNTMLEWSASLLVVLGGVACLLGSLGLARFPDVFMRLHGPSKVTTLGIGCIALAWAAFFASRGTPSLQALLLILFVALTTPVSAQLVARAALHRDLPRRQGAGEQP